MEGEQGAALRDISTAPKKPAKTAARVKADEALEKMELMATELSTALAVANRTKVPGVDPVAYLVDLITPMLAGVGLQVGPVKKVRGAK